MTKFRKPPCLTDDSTLSLEDYSTETEDEEEVEYGNATYNAEGSGEFDSSPLCCRPRDTSYVKTVDPTITQAPGVIANETYIASYSPQRNIRSDSALTRDGEPFSVGPDYPDLGPWKNFRIPENIERKNIPAGGHKSYPRMKLPKPVKNTSAYQDDQHILDLKEVAEHRKKAPRYFSTPESSSFRGGRGTDQSTVWGQDLSSFEPTNSDLWAQGVRMDSFNVIKYMTPSPKNVKVPPRLVKSYPRPVDLSQKVEPNLTRFSQVVFPGDYDEGHGLTFDAPSAGNATFRRNEGTFSRSPHPPKNANTQDFSKVVFPDSMAEKTRNINRKDTFRKPKRREFTFAQPQGTYTRSPLSLESEDSSYATPDLTDIGPWKNFEIPKNLRPLNIPHGAHRSFPRTQHPQQPKTFSTHEDQQPIMNLKEVTEHRKKAPRYYSTPQTKDFLNEGNDMSSVWGQDLSSFQSIDSSAVEDSSLGWSQGVRMDSFNVIKYMTPSPKNIKVPPRLMKSHPHLTNSSSLMDPNLTRYSKVVFPDPVGKATRNYNLQGSLGPLCRTGSSNMTYQKPDRNRVTFDYTQDTYSQSPVSFVNDVSSYGTDDFTDLGPYRNFEIPPNLQKVNVPRGAHRSFPATQHPHPAKTFSTHEDQQPIMNVKEVTEHRKKVPRYYSTPQTTDFSNEGYDQSSVWGQDLSSFQSADTSGVEDSSLGWSQGVRMDSFNVIKYMTPSPKNIKVAQRLTRSHPHLTNVSTTMDPNLTRYSKVVFPDTIGNTRRNYDIQESGSPLRSSCFCDATFQTPYRKDTFKTPYRNDTFKTPYRNDTTKTPYGNGTFRTPYRNDTTFDHSQVTNSQSPVPRTTDGTFHTVQDLTNYPSHFKSDVTYQTPARNERTFNAPQATYIQSPVSFESEGSSYCAQDLTDVGPWKNIEIPSNVCQLNIPRDAHKSFPVTRRPRPPKTFSTHEDPQPILDMKEVTEHRKKAPRYYSTPQTENFSNEGYDQSSIWGQDLSSFISADSSVFEDSSLGWSQGVRMDSFNVIKYMTPSPKNVKAPVRLMQSYPPEVTSKKTKSPYLTQYSPPEVTPEEPAEIANLTYSPVRFEQPQDTFIRKSTTTTAGATFIASEDSMENEISSPEESVPRTQVPPPSRNYLTYVDSK